MSVAMISEMFIEGKDSVNTKMIYQGKTGAVGVAQPFVVNFSENSLCRILNIFGNAKDSNTAFIYLVHEFDGCCMATSHLEKGVSFIQNIIRGADNRFIFMNLFVDDFCFVIMLVFRDGEGAKSACINKDFQSAASPYRYLS